uniref:hAT-like transposase RNase-H fold domain-containing protein n=1 Tax=Hordeum vulgare subsp. vulgare TaxID=112509 RepID=A0A8I6Y9T3_HORVV
MLKAVIQDRVLFNGFINANYNPVVPLLNGETWHVITALTAFLELFYDATVTLSGVYYPTSPLMVHTLLDIASHLKAYEADGLLLNVVADMKIKYLKYWKKVPLLYALAFILDPRAKLEGYRSALNVLSASLSLDYTDDFNTARDSLYDIYAKYEQKYSGVRMQRPPPAPTAGKKRGAWSKIFASSSSSSSTAGSSSTSASSIPSYWWKYANANVWIFSTNESSFKCVSEL